MPQYLLIEHQILPKNLEKNSKKRGINSKKIRIIKFLWPITAL